VSATFLVGPDKPALALCWEWMPLASAGMQDKDKNDSKQAHDQNKKTATIPQVRLAMVFFAIKARKPASCSNKADSHNTTTQG